MSRVNLTTKFIDSRAPATPGRRRTYRDALVPGLGLRVTDTGHKSFVLTARYPLHPKNPTRRLLGVYAAQTEGGSANLDAARARARELAKTLGQDDADPVQVRAMLSELERFLGVGAPSRQLRTEGLTRALTLADAREKARRWIEMIQRGVDPKVEEDRFRAEAMRRQSNSFEAVAREFVSRHAATLAKAGEVERIFNREFVKRWGPRPVTDILPEECAAAIRSIVRRGAKYQAHNAFGHLRRMFNWAIGTHEFGITVSPVAALRPSDLIGKRESRDRVLSDDELRAVWDACGGNWRAEAIAEARRRDLPQDALRRLAYPYGPVIHLLVLTGQRLREVSDMQWSEIDFDGRLWTIPATRMKGGRTHEVPLALSALELLRSLPRFTVGDYVFTTTDGAKPVNGFSATKGRLDRLVHRARTDVGLGEVPGWVLHDLRRTMRTHLSALPIEDRVREQMVAHAQPGLHKVYDRHSYQDEKRRGFELWENRLAGILSPAPAGVTDIATERDRRAVASV